MVIGRAGSREFILGEIMRYGFAAAIEVTNGHKNPKHKSEQAIRSKSHLESLCRYDASAAGGKACIGNTHIQDYDVELDFIIDIQKYNQDRMLRALEEVRDSPDLKETELCLLESIIEECKRGVSINELLDLTPYIECMANIKDSKDSSKSSRKYEEQLAMMSRIVSIKGVGLEIYVASLFDDNLKDKTIRIRYPFEYGDSHGQRCVSDIDNVVICQKNEFSRVLKDLQGYENITLKKAYE